MSVLIKTLCMFDCERKRLLSDITDAAVKLGIESNEELNESMQDIVVLLQCEQGMIVQGDKFIYRMVDNSHVFVFDSVVRRLRNPSLTLTFTTDESKLLASIVGV